MNKEVWTYEIVEGRTGDGGIWAVQFYCNEKFRFTFFESSMKTRRYERERLKQYDLPVVRIARDECIDRGLIDE